MLRGRFVVPTPFNTHDLESGLERLWFCREQLGPAFASALTLARACLSFATPADPAPHVLTTLWTLAEMTGKSERTIQRHLLEDTHRWSPWVRRFFDFSPNYDTMPTPNGARRVVSGTVVRFFPHTRLGPNARVKRWGSRNLAADSRAGCTKPARIRSKSPLENTGVARVSSYGTLQDEVKTRRWVFIGLEALSTSRGIENPVNPYRDIPSNAVLDAALADLEARLERAVEENTPLGLVRAAWVESVARAITLRLADAKFENLWRRLLWVALRAELHGGTRAGFWFLQRLYRLALDAKREGVLEHPVAWALELVRSEGLQELERDHAMGAVGLPCRQ